MNNCVVDVNTLITLHFSLTLEDGEVIDSTFDKTPASFHFGDGSLLKGFEEKLLGLTVGDKANFTITPEHGFGQRNSNNIQQFPRSRFDSNIVLEEGLMISFADAGQSELTGIVMSVQADRVEVDFNHPLAGHTLQFSVEIIDITSSLNNAVCK